MKLSSFLLRVCICLLVAGCLVPARSAEALPGGPTPQLVKDINTTVTVGSNPKEFTRAGEYVFFHADDGVIPANVWRTDGTSEGTIPLNFSPTILTVDEFEPYSNQFYPAGDKVFFTAYDAVHGRELWVSDGTPGGTKMVKDVAPGSINSFIQIPVALGGRLFFIANDGKAGYELWVSDGSESGTHMVKEIISSEEDAYTFFLSLTPLDDEMLVVIYDSNLRTGDLWRSDGTAEGTQFVTTVPHPQTFIQGDGLVFFTVLLPSGGLAQLYQTDGTPEGTKAAADLGSIYSVQHIAAMSGDIYVFIRTDSGLEMWAYHADEDLLKRLRTFYDARYPNNYVVESATAHGKLALSMLEYDEDLGSEAVHLWVSDGTEEGTLRIMGGFDFLFELQAAGKGFIFNGLSGAEGRQVWRSDGTQEGTTQLTHMPQAMCSQFDLLVKDGKILLPLDDTKVGGTMGCELWSLGMSWPQAYLPVVVR